MMLKKLLRKKEVNDMPIIIPERFRRAVDNHIVGNLLELNHYPLILSVFGEPGMGKTFQIRTHLEARGFELFSINAADLESDHAGEPTKLLRKAYVSASANLVGGKGAAIIIDDIDTTLGEWEHYTGTVNHQDLIAFFMHIVDSPTEIENISNNLRRVPIFFTGNDFSKIYAPLRRPGRMNLFEYLPTLDDKKMIVNSIFGGRYPNEVAAFVEQHADAPIAYFSNLRASVEAYTYSRLAGNIDFSRLISDDGYRKSMRTIFGQAMSDIDWPSFFATED